MNKYALCVGINDYSQWRAAGWDAANLPYSLKNCEDLAQLLADHVGFVPSNIGIQRDEWCNSGNILNALDDLLSKAKPGDVVCVFFSGHGTRIQGLDANGQPDSTVWYNALLPHSGTVITDYDLARLTGKLDAAHVNVTFILDTSFTAAVRPVPGLPTPVGVPLADTVLQAMVHSCHTLVPVGVCVPDPSVLKGNVSSLSRDDHARLVMALPASSYTINQAKSVLLQACAGDQTEFQVPALQEGILVAALKKVLSANAQVTHANLLTALRTETAHTGAQYVRAIASYSQLQCVPEIYASADRMNKGFLAALS